MDYEWLYLSLTFYFFFDIDVMEVLWGKIADTTSCKLDKQGTKKQSGIKSIWFIMTGCQ